MPQNSLDHRSISYGEHPDQHVVFTPSPTQLVQGTAILVHGGYWRQRISAEVMHPLRDDLLTAGWNVANVEYRRGPEQPWPIPSIDVSAAIQRIRSTLLQQGINDSSILIGHSVGGQLALLNAELVDAVVALAPVTDVAKIHEGDFGDAAAEEYFGTSPHESPVLYQRASPRHNMSSGVPLLLVHGENDDRVPVEHTRAYVHAMDEGTQPAAMIHPRLDHFEIIDPRKHHWKAVKEWMTQALFESRIQ